MKYTLAAALSSWVLLVIIAPVSAGAIRLEAEGMIASEDLGADPIHVQPCGAASNGLAVDGLDVDGEWIQLRFELQERHCFIDSLRSAGLLGEVRTFGIEIEPDSPANSRAVDTLTTLPGSGIQ